MSTIYRAVFSDDRPGLVAGARDLFRTWLTGKGIEIEVPTVGCAKSEGRTVEVITAQEGDVETIRIRLDEEAAHQRWSTILTAMAAAGEGWVWVDLERVTDDAYGPPPGLAPPGLVRNFLESSTCRAGSTILRPAYRLVDEDHVGELVEELLDPGRAIPVLVASRDTTDPGAARARAEALAWALTGVANVWALDGTATSALSKELGPDLHVYAGAVRTYFPGLTIPDRNPKRHRFARRELFSPHPRHGAQLVARAIVAKAVSGRPPLPFRNRVALMLGFTQQGREAEQLLAELVAVEDERDRLQEDLDWQILETEEAATEAETMRRRVKWLEQRAADAGDYVAGLDTPSADVPTVAGDCVEALELADAHLSLVEIGDTVETAAELDQNPKAGTWGRKAWQALRALQSYADVKSSGAWSGNFTSFCRSAPPASDVIPVEWVIAVESETTTNNPRFRQARTFPVPTTVCPEGRAYMQHHIRLEKGSDPAPRLHYWDDTGGRTGKVYVGYLGRHLPSVQTN
jgi:hypothetical protein